MRRLILASAIVVAFMLSIAATAQVHGLPPSVTSLTPGLPISAPAPSVTSLGPAGFRGSGPLGFGSRIRFSDTFVADRSRPMRGFRSTFRNRSFDRFGSFATAAPVYIPYVYPVYPIDYADAPDDPGTPLRPDVGSSGPAPRVIIIERDRLRDYSLDSRERQPAPAPTPEPKVETPVAEQPTTILIFRDGRRLEVKNYAIVGDELLNFSSSGPHRIELADLDVNATTRENDDRGIPFRLPNAVSVSTRR